MAAGLNYPSAIIIRGMKQTRESEVPCLRASLPFPTDLSVVFCRRFPFLGRLLGVSLLCEADVHRIFAELAQLRIPSVPRMLPSMLQDSQHLPVYSGGRCITSMGHGLPVKMFSLPPEAQQSVGTSQPPVPLFPYPSILCSP